MSLSLKIQCSVNEYEIISKGSENVINGKDSSIPFLIYTFSIVHCSYTGKKHWMVLHILVLYHFYMYSNIPSMFDDPSFIWTSMVSIDIPSFLLTWCACLINSDDYKQFLKLTCFSCNKNAYKINKQVLLQNCQIPELFQVWSRISYVFVA